MMYSYYRLLVHVLVVAKQPTYSYLTGHDHVGADNHKLSPNIERVAIGISPKGYFKGLVHSLPHIQIFFMKKI